MIFVHIPGQEYMACRRWLEKQCGGRVTVWLPNFHTDSLWGCGARPL